MKTLQQAIDREQAKADRAIDALINQYRIKYVIPYCDAHRLRFLSGMGGYTITNERGQRVGRGEDIYFDVLLSKRIFDIFECSVTRYNSVGSLMPDYTPKNWKG